MYCSMPSRDSLRKEEKHLENKENNNSLSDYSLKIKTSTDSVLFSFNAAQSSEIVYKYVPGYSLYLWTDGSMEKRNKKYRVREVA